MKKGISLITLIITIIVVIILAGAIILNLNNTNIIGNAEEAVVENDKVAKKVEWELFMSEEYLKYRGDRKIALYSTNGTELLYDNQSTGVTIDEIFTNTDNVSGIVDGKVVFGDTLIIHTYDILLQKVNNMGSVSSDYFYDIIKLSDGYVACGYTMGDLSGVLAADGSNAGGSLNVGGTDFLFVKFDNDLNIIKINNFGGNSGDSLYSITKTDTGYVSCGQSQSDLTGLLAADGSNAGGSTNSYNGPSRNVIIELDNNLDLVKINNFDSSYNSLNSVIEIEDGYVACGYADINNPRAKFSIIKLNDNLEVVKTKEFGGSSNDMLREIIEVEGGYVAIGRSESNLSSFTGGSPNIGGYDFVVVKLDDDLEIVKVNNFGSSSRDLGESIIKVEDGYVVVGNSQGNLSGLLAVDGSSAGGTTSQGNYDAVIAKLDDNLDLIKVNNFGGIDYDRLTDVIKVEDGYVVIGDSRSDLSGVLAADGSNAGASANVGDGDVFVAKLDSNLGLVKINNFGGSSYDYLYSIVKGNQGYVAVGNSRSDLSGVLAADGSNAGGTINGGTDFLAVKLGD